VEVVVAIFLLLLLLLVFLQLEGIFKGKDSIEKYIIKIMKSNTNDKSIIENRYFKDK
jgi:hypothetical protein